MYSSCHRFNLCRPLPVKSKHLGSFIPAVHISGSETFKTVLNITYNSFCFFFFLHSHLVVLKSDVLGPHKAQSECCVREIFSNSATFLFLLLRRWGLWYVWCSSFLSLGQRVGAFCVEHLEWRNKTSACLVATFKIAVGSCSLELCNIMLIAKEGRVAGGEIYCGQ